MSLQNSTIHSAADHSAILSLAGVAEARFENRGDSGASIWNTHGLSGQFFHSGLWRGIGKEPASGTSGGLRTNLPDQREHSQESPTNQLDLSGKAILVVDDIDGVRDLIREVLEMDGFEVLQAEDGKAALQVARQHPGPIHVLLTDVVMPRMGGKVLADQLLQERPDVRVVFMSGYSDEAVAHHGVLQPGTAFLKKPFSSGSLTRCVRKEVGKA